MKTLAFGKVGSCFAFICLDTSFNENEWRDYIQFLKANLTPGMQPRCIVVSEGGGPNSAQRQQLNEIIEPYRSVLKVAVLTRSPLARGIVTALSWFNPVFRPFSPDDLEHALEYLEMPRTKHGEVQNLLTSVRKQLAPGGAGGRA